MYSDEPRYLKGGKLRKNYDGDPDWDVVGSAGLKSIKAQRALTTYEQKGEPVYDKDGAYIEGNDAVNLAHHTELQKNLKANRTNETILRQKKLKDYLTDHPGGRVYAQNQMNGARDYATKLDNRHRALQYHYGLQGQSTSKDREINARIKKNYTPVQEILKNKKGN